MPSININEITKDGVVVGFDKLTRSLCLELLELPENNIYPHKYAYLKKYIKICKFFCLNRIREENKGLLDLDDDLLKNMPKPGIGCPVTGAGEYKE